MSRSIFSMGRIVCAVIAFCCFAAPSISLADEPQTAGSAENWDGIQPAELEKLFGDLNAPDPLNEAGVKLKGHLTAVSVKRDPAANPPFSIQFEQAADSTLTKDEFASLCEQFQKNCFGQLEKSGFVNKRLTQSMQGDWEKGEFKREFTIKSSSGPKTSDDAAKWNPFRVPAGLSMPADELLRRTGYASPPDLIGKPFPFTPRTCTELATLCFNLGLFQDGKALCDHILAHFPTDARLLFIRGCCELGLNEKQACNKTLLALREVWGEGLPLQQVADINGPIAVRFLLAYLSLEQFE
jgi:hypothetical protein